MPLISKQKTYNRIARHYVIFDLPFEHSSYKPLHRKLFKGLSRHLFDAGVGTERNFLYYADGTGVTVIDLNPVMLGQAHWR